MDNHGQIHTRFLLISDTHARAPNHASSPHPCRWPLPKADVAIHTGDLTMNGTIRQHEHAINCLKNLPADLKIVIPGNHDITLDTEYYLEHGDFYGPFPKYSNEDLDKIRNLYIGLGAQNANIVYLEEGTKTLTLRNGARLTVYASAYTPEFCNWAFAYPRTIDRYNGPSATNAVGEYEQRSSKNIDIFLTHGPPFGVLDNVDDLKIGTTAHVGCEHLYTAISRAKPLLHCFGHIHEGWGAVRRKWPSTATSVSDADTTSNALSSVQENFTAEDTTVAVDLVKVNENMGIHVDATDLVRGDETLFVNSSIMDVHYRPCQAPWVVDLMLPRWNTN